MEYYEELTYALKHLSVVQSFYYAGRLEAYKENCGSSIDCDEDFLYANWWELLEAAADLAEGGHKVPHPLDLSPAGLGQSHVFYITHGSCVPFLTLPERRCR